MAFIKIRQGGEWKEIHDEKKQDTLIGTVTTGQNIKTINGETILGTGDLTIASEPDAYIKNIAEASNVYTATKKDGSTVSWEIPDISGKADTSTVEGIATRVGTLETDIVEKAAQADLTALTTRVGTNETNITSLQTNKADNSALDSYILKTAVDGTTIKFEDNVLKAILPKSMIFKGSEEFVTKVLAKTGEIGDTWFAEKDDRKTPEESTSPIVNALITYSESGWVYVGDTSIDLSEYAKQADLDTLDGKVSTLDGTVSTLDTTVSTHTTEIAAKADKTSLDETNTQVGELHTALGNHESDTDIHVNPTEKEYWNNKQELIDGDNPLSADFLSEGSVNKLVTEADKTKWDGYATSKQDTLSAERLAACDSGITTSSVAQIGTNTTNIQAINDSEVMKSGITSTLVGQISTNQTDISTINSSAVMTSGIDSTKVAQIATNTANIATKQKQITYSETEPSGSADGDVWVF